MKFGKAEQVKVAEKKRIEENARLANEDAIAHAQRCLRDPEFIKYKEAYGKMKDALIEQLMLVDRAEYDPVKYGFMCKDIVAKFRHISSLLRAVEGEAGK